MRGKTLLATGITFCILSLGAYFGFRAWLLQTYAVLESRESKLNVERVDDALEQQIEDFHLHSRDWSDWDETFNFISHKNQDYIDSNLRVITLKLDTMLFLAPDGRIVYENPAKRTPGVTPPNGTEIVERLGFSNRASPRPARFATSGLIEVGGIPMIVSVRPVIRSSGKGPSNGWIVFALWVDKAEVESLALQTHLDVELHPIDDRFLDGSIKSAVLAGNYEQIISGQGNILGYKAIRNIQSAPIKIIQVRQPRPIYQQAQKTLSYLILGIFAIGLVFAAVFLGLLEWIAFSRVSNLSRQVESLGDAQDGSLAVQLTGNDELSWLASKIDRMIERLREHRAELHQNNEDLQEKVAQLAGVNSILENAVEGIGRLDRSGRFAGANNAFRETLGFQKSDLCECPWESIISASDHEKFRRALEVARVQGKVTIEVTACGAARELYHLELVIVRAEASDGESGDFHLFMKNITERRNLEMRIEHQAFHDALTGLPNRSLFMDRLSHSLVKAHRHGDGVAVIFMDLDDFKFVNDSLGHEAGDQLLRQVGGRISKCLRPEDTIARLGGDEFTILLEGLHEVGEVQAIARRIVEEFRLPFDLPQGEACIGTSIGIAYSAAGNYSPDVLLRDADTAMYHAKNQGKNSCVVFDLTMNDAVNERIGLETGLRRSLSRSELFLVYQPIVDLESGDICATEALLRWQHPEQGLIMPDRFIPLAEETGLIVPIGEWVLREACRQTKEWHRDFPTTPLISINVNLSAKQLQRPDIVERIHHIVSTEGLEPGYVKLEITESAIMSDRDDAVGKLVRLRDLGYRLAIDDFGTGYSSMANLSAFPVDTVKIDREYISRMGDEGEVDAIVAAIIYLSRTMHLAVTAEGLEDRCQLTYLQSLGCHEGQGYYFARPLSADHVRDRLKNGLNVSMELEQRFQEEDQSAA
ncbi:MAG: EAL domain-containing protein [Fimbriimonadaceae bacterium]|nr:EAL domain-containing protein [Fimbriimonadaceae bacterium]